MKRLPVILLAVYAALLSVVVVVQFFDQSKLRHEVAELRAELAEQTASVQQTRDELLKLHSSSELYRKESKELRRQLVESAAPLKAQPVDNAAGQ